RWLVSAITSAIAPDTLIGARCGAGAAGAAGFGSGASGGSPAVAPGTDAYAWMVEISVGGGRSSTCAALATTSASVAAVMSVRASRGATSSVKVATATPATSTTPVASASICAPALDRLGGTNG